MYRKLVIALIVVAVLLGALPGCLGRPEFNQGVMFIVMQDMQSFRNDIFNFFVGKPHYPFEYPMVPR